MKKITIDASRCTGCGQCALTCSFRQAGVFDPRQSHIRIVQWEDFCLSVPLVCQQCDDARCIVACPTEALYRHPATGAILLQAAACINCAACASDCTYQVMRMTDADLPMTCDLCGGNPACVRVCYPGALGYAEVDRTQWEPLRPAVSVLVQRAAGARVAPTDWLLDRGKLGK
jgi:carbon-monoxide dehydrogenase iron sulfur subunit